MSNEPEADAVATMQRKGLVIVISGPSGAGKTSICNQLLERLPDATWSVSATTRPRRGNEADGENYRFVSREQFQRMRDNGEFLETAEFVGEMYGTPIQPVRDAVRGGKQVVMEIDVQGGIQVARRIDDAVLIFVLPPTRESLEARLKGRQTESEAEMQRRLAQADGEIAVARDSGHYRYFVTNDVLEETVQRVIRIIKQEMQET